MASAAFHACAIGPNGGSTYKHGVHEVGLDLSHDDAPGVKLALRGEMRDGEPFVRLIFSDASGQRELWFGPLSEAGGLTHVPLPEPREAVYDGQRLISCPAPLAEDILFGQGLLEDAMERSLAGDPEPRVSRAGPLDFLRDNGATDFPVLEAGQAALWANGSVYSIENDVGPTTVEDAVEEWVEDRWADMDYSREVRVGVIFPDGEQKEYLVAALDTVEFEATLIEQEA